MNKRWMILPALAAAGFAQTDSAIRRDGSQWAETTTGTVKAPARGRLRVESSGSVSVRGQADGLVSYTLRKRVRAAGEAEARRLFERAVLRVRTEDDLVTITFVAPRERQMTAELELSVPRWLEQTRLQTNWGNVQAYDLDGTVEAETGAGALRLDRIGKGAVARSGGGAVWVGTVNGPVRCVSGGGTVRIERAGGETWVESAGGEVRVREVLGALHVATGGGSIWVQRAAAIVDARTAGGIIEVQEAGGSVTARTAGGGIEVGQARGVECDAHSGAIRLRSVSGALKANTASGSIFAEFAASGLLDSILSTGSGDVTVFIPSNVAVTVRAQNESGSRAARIVSDFPEIRAQAAALSMAVAEGAINGGGPVLRLSTANGTIFLRRQK